MDPTKLLKKQHREVQSLFPQMESTTKSGRRNGRPRPATASR